MTCTSCGDALYRTMMGTGPTAGTLRSERTTSTYCPTSTTHQHTQ